MTPTSRVAPRSTSDLFQQREGRLTEAAAALAKAREAGQGEAARRLLPEIVGAQAQLARALEGLSERERQVLVMRFGLADGKPRTLEEVGVHFNVTRERIRQLETKALAKLRTKLEHVVGSADGLGQNGGVA